LSGWRAEMRELLPNLEAGVVRMKRLQKGKENRELARVVVLSKDL
jgi:hypothetical protein